MVRADVLNNWKHHYFGISFPYMSVRFFSNKVAYSFVFAITKLNILFVLATLNTNDVKLLILFGLFLEQTVCISESVAINGLCLQWQNADND